MTVQQVQIGGQARKVREESIDSEIEHWNEYTLANGDKVRVKVLVHKIFRVLDAEGNPALTEEGDPEILVRHQIHISVSGGPEPNIDGEVH